MTDKTTEVFQAALAKVPIPPDAAKKLVRSLNQADLVDMWYAVSALKSACSVVLRERRECGSESEEAQ